MKEGNQISLRDWQLSDLEAFEFWHIGKKRWMEFDAPYYRKPSAVEIQLSVQQLTERIRRSDWPSPRKRLVIADKETDKLIGTVSWYWQSKATNWKSIGIAIYDEAYWGKGIGFEALKLWIDYLFEVSRDIVRLDLRTWSGNERMMNLATKLGFKEEARFRMARVVNGIYYDSIGMGVLRGEWKK